MRGKSADTFPTYVFQFCRIEISEYKLVFLSLSLSLPVRGFCILQSNSDTVEIITQPISAIYSYSIEKTGSGISYSSNRRTSNYTKGCLGWIFIGKFILLLHLQAISFNVYYDSNLSCINRQVPIKHLHNRTTRLFSMTHRVNWRRKNNRIFGCSASSTKKKHCTCFFATNLAVYTPINKYYDIIRIYLIVNVNVVELNRFFCSFFVFDINRILTRVKMNL